MTWFALLVFVSFLAIVFTMVPRVLRVFSGNRWTRIAAGLMMLAPAAAIRWAVHSSP